MAKKESLRDQEFLAALAAEKDKYDQIEVVDISIARLSICVTKSFFVSILFIVFCSVLHNFEVPLILLFLVLVISLLVVQLCISSSNILIIR